MLETSAIIALLLEFKYLGVFAGVFIGGEILLTIIGFMASLGFFKIHFAIVFAILGVLIGDIIWYILGHQGRNLKLSQKIRKKLGEEKITKLENKFKHHSVKTILLVRVIYGLRSVTLFMAGFTKMHFFSFITLNFIGTFIWGIVLISLGYFFGQSIMLLQKYIENIMLLISIAVFFIFLILAIIYFTKKSLIKKI